MRTYLILALLTTTFFLNTNKTEAHPVMCAPVVAGAPYSATIAFTGGMAAFAALPAIIVGLQDVDPWHKVFPVVEQDYPAQHDVHAGAKPVQVAYFIPETGHAAVYPYKDKTGMHYPKVN